MILLLILLLTIFSSVTASSSLDCEINGDDYAKIQILIHKYCSIVDAKKFAGFFN